jgi:hypothetical protein
METVPGRWYDDSVALSVALAELDWIPEDDLLTDGDLPVEGDGSVVAALPVGEGAPAWSSTDWAVQETSVQEVLDRVAGTPPGPQPIRWLTSLDGRPLSRGEALAVAGAWERQARWVTARQQGAWLGFVGPVGPGRLGPDGPTEKELRRESSNLLELALTIDCGVEFTRDKVDQARLLAGTLSATRDRLAAGELSEYRARRIAQELRTLDPVTAQQIETKVLTTANTVRVPTLIRRLRRLVLAARGPAAVAAHQAGLADRRVVVDSEAVEVGLLGLHAYLPPEQTLAIRELLETKAKELARADRAARAEVKRLNRERAQRKATGPQDGGTQDERTQDGGPQDERTQDGGPQDGGGQDGGGQDGGGQDAGGHGSGVGGDGGLLELPVRRTKDQRMADALAILLLGADQQDPAHPVKPQVAVQVTIDLPTLVHLRTHPGELLGYGPIPAEIARELAGDAAWQRFVHEPVTGYLRDVGDQRYHPGPAITRFRVARDVRCRFPGSTRKARHSEGDHVIPHRDGGGGGRTSSANLASLSKLGHIAKTHNGWKVSGNANGALTWTSPHGHTYTTTPHDYRAEDDPPPF